MDIGSGIIVGSAILGGVAVTFKILESKKGCNKENTIKQCPEHSGLVAGISSIKEGQDRHEKWLKEIVADMQVLLRR